MKDLMNPNILDLTPYKPGKPVEEIQRKYNLEKVIKLASNENPFPLPAHVTQAIINEIPKLNTYPCSDSYYLRNLLAKYNKIAAENIVVGSGSVEIIRMIIKAYLKPGEKVLSSEKTFVMYKIATLETAGKMAYVEAPMGDDYTFDLDRMAEMVDARTKIIFITNPNNPTGTMLPRQKIIDFINKMPQDKIIVLDNAYQEYVANQDEYFDGIEMALNRPNVIVLRTFSKVYALAGLRIGYAIANDRAIAYLGRVKAPFNVTRIAQAAAIASLENDDFKNESARLNRKNREKLYKQMTGMGLKVVPSETNFLMFFPETNIPKLNERLLEQGVIIRPIQAFGVPNGMRVSIGVEEDNDFFVKTLQKTLEEMK